MTLAGSPGGAAAALLLGWLALGSCARSDVRVSGHRAGPDGAQGEQNAIDFARDFFVDGALGTQLRVEFDQLELAFEGATAEQLRSEVGIESLLGWLESMSSSVPSAETDPRTAFLGRTEGIRAQLGAAGSVGIGEPMETSSAGGSGLPWYVERRSVSQGRFQDAWTSREHHGDGRVAYFETGGALALSGLSMEEADGSLRRASAYSSSVALTRYDGGFGALPSGSSTALAQRAFDDPWSAEEQGRFAAMEWRRALSSAGAEGNPGDFEVVRVWLERTGDSWRPALWWRSVESPLGTRLQDTVTALWYSEGAGDAAYPARAISWLLFQSEESNDLYVTDASYGSWRAVNEMNGIALAVTPDFQIKGFEASDRSAWPERLSALFK